MTNITQEINEMHRSGRSADTIAQQIETFFQHPITVEQVEAVIAESVKENCDAAIKWLNNQHGGHGPYDVVIRDVTAYVQSLENRLFPPAVETPTEPTNDQLSPVAPSGEIDQPTADGTPAEPTEDAASAEVKSGSKKK